MSKFNEDLGKEKILGQFLDTIYKNLNLEFERVGDRSTQHRGIDLIYHHKNSIVHIDEKAQLHYLNKNLPTFTFELSYIKENMFKKGWLLDTKKQTDYYFLVTGIFLNGSKLRLENDIERCKIFEKISNLENMLLKKSVRNMDHFISPNIWRSNRLILNCALTIF